MTERPGDAPKVACPACGSFHSAVKEGRSVDNGTYRRRRECRTCGRRFSTIEIYLPLGSGKKTKNATSRDTTSA